MKGIFPILSLFIAALLQMILIQFKITIVNVSGAAIYETAIKVLLSTVVFVLLGFYYKKVFYYSVEK